MNATMFLLAGFLTTTSHAQAPGLSLKVTPSRESIPAWAVVSVDVSFECSSSAVPFSERLLYEPYAGARLRLSLRSPGEDEPRVFSPTPPRLHRHVALGEPEMLAPGQTRTLQLVLDGLETVAPDRTAPGSVTVGYEPHFRSEGTYELRAIYEWGGASVESPPVTLRVGAPPESAVEALQRMSGLSRLAYAYDSRRIPSKPDRRHVREVESLAMEYAGTLYGDMARVSLAGWNLHSARLGMTTPGIEIDVRRHLGAARRLLEAPFADDLPLGNRVAELRAELTTRRAQLGAR